jgi:hypothetical protein
VGLAFDGYFRHVGELLNQWTDARRDIVENVPGAQAVALRSQMAALDRRSLVVLGDPTITLPPVSHSAAIR